MKAVQACRAIVVRELMKFTRQYGRLASAVVRPEAKNQVSEAWVVHGLTSAPLGPSTRCSTEIAPPGSSTRAAA